MKKIAICLFSILALSMVFMSVAPAFAVKPVKVAAAHAQLQNYAMSPTNFQVDIINDGDVTIVKVHLTVSTGVLVLGWGYPDGWSITGGVNDVTFWAKGNTVIKTGGSAAIHFTVDEPADFTVTWTAYGKKDIVIGTGTLEYYIPSI